MLLTNWCVVLDITRSKVLAYDYMNGKQPWLDKEVKEYKILGFVAFKDEDDAIKYAKEVLLE